MLGQEPLDFQQELTGEQMLGDVLVVEGIEHDEIVPCLPPAHALGEHPPVFLEHARLWAGFEVEVLVGDPHHRGIDLDGVDLRVGQDLLQDAR